MKVLAINSSPRSAKESYTVMMLNCLVEGMRESGADVEIINLREKKIKYCSGCFTCWTKTPGQCLHQDDMSREIFPKWLACDLAVYATPLYYHTVNANMSTFMERTLPAIMPFFEEGEDGKTCHPTRTKIPPSVILTVCGFPELSEFDALKQFINSTRHKGSDVLATICRSGASLLTSPFLQAKAKEVLDATRQAGRELVTSMKISPETMTQITQSMGSPQLFCKMGNIYWKTCIAEGITPKVFDERKMIPRPGTLDDFMLIFVYGLNAQAAGDSKVFVQFKFSGKVEEPCYFTIAGGKVSATAGICENPSLTIEAPFDVWMDIITRKADGAKMLMEQKYTVSGDLALMMQLFQKENSPAAK